jgi:hypothetical protein
MGRLLERLLVASLIVAGVGGVAEARRGGGAFVLINTGDTIIHIKDLPKEATLDTSLVSDPGAGAPHVFNKLGYRHERFGLFWFDLWRWDGEFVVYDGDTYISISDEMAAELGESVPWRYHLPDGLLILIAVAYFVLIGRRRRRVKTGFVIAGFMLVVAIAFFFMGLTWELGIPLAIAVHHGFSARAAMRAVDDDETDPGDDVPSRAPQASAPRAAVGTPPPGPRTSQPIVIERPPVVVAPPIVPMRPDDTADGPKLLR